MHEELEEALRELEAKLPDLRHLIVESGGVLSASPSAQLVAARLLRSVAVADELASQLRLLLLNGGQPPVVLVPPIVPSSASGNPPDAPQEPSVPAEPAPPEATPEQTFAATEPLSESDAALLEALGLAPDTHTVFGAPESEAQSEELSVEQQIEDLSARIAEALARGDREQALELVAEKHALKYPELAEHLKRDPSQGLAKSELERLERLVDYSRYLGETSDEPVHNYGSFSITESDRKRLFDDFWKEYEPVLQDAVYFYLESASETATVVSGTEDQAERVWNASGGEASQLEIVSTIAAYRCDLLLPRDANEPARRVPTARQIFAHLETYRFERNVKELEDEIARLEANAREEDVDVSAQLAERRGRLERLISSFYNRRLHLDDDDEDFSGGAIGSKIDPPDPVRDPGSGRTFEEALAAARNP